MPAVARTHGDAADSGSQQEPSYGAEESPPDPPTQDKNGIGGDGRKEEPEKSRLADEVALPPSGHLVVVLIVVLVALLILCVPIISLSEKALTDVETRTSNLAPDAVTVVLLFLAMLSFLGALSLALFEFFGRATLGTRTQDRLDRALERLEEHPPPTPGQLLELEDNAATRRSAELTATWIDAVKTVADAAPKVLEQFRLMPPIIALLFFGLLAVGGAAGIAVGR